MFLYFSIFINFVFLYFVYILNYKSLDLKGKSCDIKLKPQTKRVVLFVVEDLGARFFRNVTSELGEERSFFYRLGQGEAIRGNSRSPSLGPEWGNIALISGTAYDPSLISNFMKITKYKLDHVFNRASHVYFMGDPFLPNLIGVKSDLLKPFPKDFSHEMEEHRHYFAYDEYTLDRLDFFFRDSRHKNETSNGNAIYAFYLPAFKICTSKSKNLNYCVPTFMHTERHIQKTVDRFHEYFNDNMTTFILASDQESDLSWTGKKIKTGREITPFLFWGKAIKKGLTEESISFQKEDVANLISTLLGNEFPNNSVGILPHSILDVNLESLAEALYCNENQINEIIAKYAETTGHLDKTNITSIRSLLKGKMANRSYSEVKNISGILLKLHKDRLEYYYYVILPSYWVALTLLYLGFASWALSRVALSALVLNYDFTPKNSFWEKFKKDNFKKNLKNDFAYDIGFAMIAVDCSLFCYFKGAQFIMIVACCLITFVWWRAFKNLKSFFESTEEKLAVWFLLVFFLSFALVWTIFIIYPIVRQIFLGVIAVSVLATASPLVENYQEILLIIFTGFLAFFQNFNIAHDNLDTKFFITGCVIWGVAMVSYIVRNRRSIRDVCFVFIYLCLISISLWNSIIVLNTPKGMPKKMYTLVSWIVIFLSPVLPIIAAENGAKRFCHVCFSFCGCYILMSTHEEVIGLFVLAGYLLALFTIEIFDENSNILAVVQRNARKRTKLERKDLKRGFFLMVIIWCSFFASGNRIITIEERWTKNFFEKYDFIWPVVAMTVYKISLPIIFTCSMFGILYKKLNADINLILDWFVFLSTLTSLYLLAITKGRGDPLEETVKSVTYATLSHLFTILVILITKIFYLINNIDLKAFFQRNDENDVPS